MFKKYFHFVLVAPLFAKCHTDLNFFSLDDFTKYNQNIIEKFQFQGNFQVNYDKGSGGLSEIGLQNVTNK